MLRRCTECRGGTMGPDTIVLIVGAVLVVTGVLGGGIELRELKIPTVRAPTRILAVLVGLVFLGIGLDSTLLDNDSPEQVSNPNELRFSNPPQQGKSNDEWLHSQLMNAVYDASDAESRA